ncbi:hypothetical protein L1887_05249 [Cichorium endivia]|nr:hypothetical protein L1887_05249 [Cichorium endivia]
MLKSGVAPADMADEGPPGRLKQPSKNRGHRLQKLKVSFKAKYNADKATPAFITDALLVYRLSALICLTLAVDKPESFSIDYNVPKKVVRIRSNTWKFIDVMY